MSALPANDIQAIATMWQHVTSSAGTLDPALRDHWLDRAAPGSGADRARLALAVIDGLLDARAEMNDEHGAERAMEEFLELLAHRARSERRTRVPAAGLPRRSVPPRGATPHDRRHT